MTVSIAIGVAVVIAIRFLTVALENARTDDDA